MSALLVEDWCIVVDTSDPYTAPEMRLQQFQGRLPDGREFTIQNDRSQILGKCGEVIVMKRGENIILGQPKADCEAAFPNARQRAYDSLPEVGDAE